MDEWCFYTGLTHQGKNVMEVCNVNSQRQPKTVCSSLRWCKEHLKLPAPSLLGTSIHISQPLSDGIHFHFHCEEMEMHPDWAGTFEGMYMYVFICIFKMCFIGKACLWKQEGKSSILADEQVTHSHATNDPHGADLSAESQGAEIDSFGVQFYLFPFEVFSFKKNNCWLRKFLFGGKFVHLLIVQSFCRSPEADETPSTLTDKEQDPARPYLSRHLANWDVSKRGCFNWKGRKLSYCTCRQVKIDHRKAGTQAAHAWGNGCMHEHQPCMTFLSF